MGSVARAWTCVALALAALSGRAGVAKAEWADKLAEDQLKAWRAEAYVRAYDGPERPREAIAVVQGTGNVVLWRVDGRCPPGPNGACRNVWDPRIELLPGRHELCVGYRKEGKDKEVRAGGAILTVRPVEQSMGECAPVHVDAVAGKSYELKPVVSGAQASTGWAPTASYELRMLAATEEILDLGIIVDHAEAYKRDENTATNEAEYQRRCDEGAGEACHDLGLLYANGTATTRDEAKALLFFQKACRLKYTVNLGPMKVKPGCQQAKFLEKEINARRTSEERANRK